MPSNPTTGLLGDTVDRDYSRKLQLFNRHAEPELRSAIDGLGLLPGMRVLDAGCGTGEALHWLARGVGAEGSVTGMDLSAAHVAIARATAPQGAQVLQGDLQQAPLPAASFDLIWCVNTINHVHEPLPALAALLRLLRPGGRLALGQSALLPEMYFAWDARLERLTHAALRQYYLNRYGLDERRLTAIRAIAGLLRDAGLQKVAVRTLAIERLSPLDAATREYLQEAIFRDTWGERLRPYLEEADHAQLTRLCDPQHAGFALERPDFHFIQSFTLAVGTRIG